MMFAPRPAEINARIIPPESLQFGGVNNEFFVFFWVNLIFLIFREK